MVSGIYTGVTENGYMQTMTTCSYRSIRKYFISVTIMRFFFVLYDFTALHIEFTGDIKLQLVYVMSAQTFLSFS